MRQVVGLAALTIPAPLRKTISTFGWVPRKRAKREESVNLSLPRNCEGGRTPPTPLVKTGKARLVG